MKKILVLFALLAYGIPAAALDYAPKPSLILDKGKILGFTEAKGRHLLTVSFRGEIYFCLVARDEYACYVPEARTEKENQAEYSLEKFKRFNEVFPD